MISTSGFVIFWVTGDHHAYGALDSSTALDLHNKDVTRSLNVRSLSLLVFRSCPLRLRTPICPWNISLRKNLSWLTHQLLSVHSTS